MEIPVISEITGIFFKIRIQSCNEKLLITVPRFYDYVLAECLQFHTA